MEKRCGVRFCHIFSRFSILTIFSILFEFPTDKMFGCSKVFVLNIFGNPFWLQNPNVDWQLDTHSEFTLWKFLMFVPDNIPNAWNRSIYFRTLFQMLLLFERYSSSCYKKLLHMYMKKSCNFSSIFVGLLAFRALCMEFSESTLNSHLHFSTPNQVQLSSGFMKKCDDW